MADVNIFHTTDNGEITIENGTVGLTNTLGPAVYLSMFGGNADDDGRADNPLKYWGNIDEADPAYWARSETQHLLQSLPAIPANLRRIEDAAGRDLFWVTDTGAGNVMTISASIPGLNKITILVNIDDVPYKYTENWGS